MAITGAHVLVYSPEAEAVRRLFRDVMAWDHIDAGDGWLIFGLPPAEIAVHPGHSASHELTLMCDDLATTMAELGDRGIEFSGEPADEGWGIVVTMVLPGNVEVLLYEPRHPTAV